ncbi:MAG: sigma 54-interacting transcriptional regulator [Gemmatimonadaceae bacterium]|nr:sigma 54-interacting transcriptional regulator [Gemmatimonadaceae bacterium]
MSKSNSDTQSNPLLSWGQYRQKIDRDVLHLAIAWSCDEPRRIGEVAAIMEPCILGRGLPPSDDSVPRTLFHQQRPVEPGRMAPLDGPHVSRRQLELTPLRDGTLKVRSLSRRPLILHGEIVERGVVRPGDTVTVQDVLVLLVVQRRCRRPTLPICSPVPVFPFGEADAYGIVGESSAAWALREAIAFAASSGKHVLVLGESGVGKELAARAIHALSPRRDGPFIARNAATFPESLIDSELFGSAKSYPNVGSPERPGLLGEVDGGTLFLDEIGELPERLQVHLLRVLDGGGEYQRLGEPFMRRANFRLVAATNRPAEALKPDFLARFKVQVEVPGLDRLVGAGVFYGAAMTEAAAVRNQDVVVVGGANSAGQGAMFFSRYARKVTMVIRGGSLAAGMSQYLVERIGHTPNIHVRLNTKVTGVQGEARLGGVEVTNTATGTVETIPACGLFIFIGTAPRTDVVRDLVQLDAQGFILTGPDLMTDGKRPRGWTLARDPFLFETSVPGIFAAGDARSGSGKRVASAVGEGSATVRLVHSYLQTV